MSNEELQKKAREYADGGQQGRNTEYWKGWGSGAYHGHKSGYLSASSEISSLKAEVERLKESAEETWRRAAVVTLAYVADTFRNNAHKADKLSDRDVFEAIADTLHKHPLPDYVDTLKTT